jgi:hypothetical protein
MKKALPKGCLAERDARRGAVRLATTLSPCGIIVFDLYPRGQSCGEIDRQ